MGLRRDEAHAGNIAWLTATRRAAAGDPRPFVIWKFAATLDGRSAALDGTSQWITSPEARADVQEVRAGVDAIMVGVGTVVADNPHLTARNDAGALQLSAGRVIVDSSGRMPARGYVTRRANVHHGRARCRPGWSGRPRQLAALRRGCRRMLGGPGRRLPARGAVDEVIGYTL
jgi:diaminohydroxyphosphoribosylaminopyrimidine deaminase/5-amino-6-(5-phosphoribosylamino)uracil reductase